jgi:hypothetical protein
MTKYLRKEALPHIWLCNRSHLNLLIYEENFIIFFNQCALKIDTTTDNVDRKLPCRKCRIVADSVQLWYLWALYVKYAKRRWKGGGQVLVRGGGGGWKWGKVCCRHCIKDNCRKPNIVSINISLEIFQRRSHVHCTMYTYCIYHINSK